MEDLEEVKLSDVCRSCLIKNSDMIGFYPKNDTTSDIVAMLSSVGNVEIEINEFMPSFVCKDCEAKLRLSYDFQLLIQRSNEIIRQCINGTDLISGLDDISQVEIKITDSEPVAYNIASFENGRGPRVSQFAASEVEEAIRQCKDKFNENVNCIRCGFISSNTRALSVHMTHLHKEMKDHWCSLCNAEVEILSEHLLTHAEDDLKCRFCGKSFMSKGHYTEHLLSHSSNRPHKCYICRKGFIAARYLNKHLRLHMNNTPHKCVLCSKVFILKNSLRNHLKKHHQSDTIKSDQETSGKDEEDVELPHEPQNFCRDCEKRVRSLPEHLSRCHSSDSYQSNREKDNILCSTCGKQFKSFSIFHLHTRTHTGEAPYKCSYCDKRTTSRNQMVVHERIHTGEKPHVCSICGKGFAQSSVLNTHMKLHTGRPEICVICSKRFCRPAQLRLHMRKHTGEKPYPCTACNQAFKQKSHLNEHIKIHSDERPYQCSHCDKAFKQSSSLKSHIQIHLGTKPYKCNQCPYACRQSYSLTQHMRQHSSDHPKPEKPHLCSICQKGFSTIAMRTSHINVAHTFKL